MKLTISTLILLFCNLNASQFLSLSSLEKSLDFPATFERSVGTLFATNLETLEDIEVDFENAGIKSKSFKAATGTCFAISQRHFLTSFNTLKLIEGVSAVRGCFVSMANTIPAQEVRFPSFLYPFYHKVAQIHREPRGKLAILELEYNLNVNPLPLGVFHGKKETMGISTACPTLLGDPTTKAKLLHNFIYSGGNIGRKKNRLEAWFVLRTNVTVDMVRGGTIPFGSIKPVSGHPTSILANGDSGAPLLQDGSVVAVCDGCSLSSVTIKEKPVYVLENQFIPVEHYITWIRSILESRVDVCRG